MFNEPKSDLNKYVGVMGFDKFSKGLIEFYKESCYGEPVLNDTKKINTFNYSVSMDVLNVCIPYSRNFNNIVAREIKKTKAKLTIIRSSVAPLTTKRIRDKVNNVRYGYKIAVVYSPIIGIQGDVRKYFLKFKQFIGYDNECDEKLVREHFSLLRIKKKPCYLKPSVAVEINKLVDTTYSGVCLSFINYIDELFEIYSVPFSSFESYNKSVNFGYHRLKLRNFGRPIFEPPKGQIKGNTIIPNAILLNKCLKSKIIKNVIDLK